MPVSVAFAVAIKLAALRIGSFCVDVRSFECCRVGDGDVAVDALEDGGVAVGDAIELPARGENFVGPKGVIPTAALSHLPAGALSLRLDAVEHVIE